MFANMSGWHLLIILAVVLLLFGATRLPALSRSVGQSVRIFRSETKHLNDEKKAETTETDATSSTPFHTIPAETPPAPRGSQPGM